MQKNQDDHRQPRLNFDVLRHICNFLTDVSDTLSFSLTCSTLRKGALQRRLWISPVVLSNSELIARFHTFIFVDAAALAPYIYGLNLSSFYYNGESEDACNRSEAAVGHLIDLLDLATHLQSLRVQIAIGDLILTDDATLLTLRELFLRSENYDGARLHKLLNTLRSPLRRLHIESSEPEDFHASFLHGCLAHLAPTLEVLELEDFPLDLSPSSVTTQFTALRTLKTKTISFVSRLDVLWWLFPSLDTLIVDHLDTRFAANDYAAARERSRDRQKACPWSRLDRVVCEADMAFLMCLQCPVRRMDLTASEGRRPLQFLTAALRENCPAQLRLSLSFDHGLSAIDELFPAEMEKTLTHLVIFASVDVQTVDTGHRSHLSWTEFMDGLVHSMHHLRLTHLRVVFHYKIHHLVMNTSAASVDDDVAYAHTARDTDLHRVAARLFDALPTLQHVFLTHCGRKWVWAGSYTQLHSKWSGAGAWRRAVGADENVSICPSSLKRRSCVEISATEAEAVVDREELQLSRREEDMIRPCGDTKTK